MSGKRLVHARAFAPWGHVEAGGGCLRKPSPILGNIEITSPSLLIIFCLDYRAWIIP